MIRFVDLNTGNIFNPGDSNQGNNLESTYIFWFDNEQSIDLIYSKTICVISDSSKISISIPNNDIFKLIDDSKIEIGKLNDLDNIQSLNGTISKTGLEYGSLFLYVFYITAQANQSGEYIEDIFIQEETGSREKLNIKIGADFYGENESLYINLANHGLEIPGSIQKAIYGTNVFEDKKDNILLNRKWKEILSNLLDIYINKGSYKSLYNSLKWFEYGDNLKLQEVWKDNKNNILFLQDISNHMSEKYIGSFDGLAKTTYYALSYTLDYIDGMEGSINDKKPSLKQISDIWSATEMTMKLCLLGLFYKRYFMPIHLDLLFHTVENTTFMDNMKRLTGVGYERLDTVNETSDIICNIQDNDEFIMSDVECYVGPKTLFGNKYTEGDDIPIIGVQTQHVNFQLYNDQIDHAQIRDYAAQLYKSYGCIVKFNIKINLQKGDMIKREYLRIECDKWDKPRDITNYFLYNSDIDFNILCQDDGVYKITLQFDSLSGHKFVKSIKFKVKDIIGLGLSIYKIKRTQNIKTINSLLNRSQNTINKYTQGIIPDYSNVHQSLYKQYIPAQISNGDGVGLNHMLIYQDISHNELNSDYFLITKHVKDNDDQNMDHIYYIYISKKFVTINQGPYNKDKIHEYIFEKLKETVAKRKDYLNEQLQKYNNGEIELPQYVVKLYNNELISIDKGLGFEGGLFSRDIIFVPEFHHLEKFGQVNDITSININDFIITDKDAICIIPNFGHGNQLDDFEWKFINNTLDNSFKLPDSIIEPFVTSGENSFLKPGYYDIIFRYKLINNSQYDEIKWKSAFIKK